jgi:alpha-D-ribose 1-methylphosphonate 5-triphosphate synthase subunit PhnH
MRAARLRGGFREPSVQSAHAFRAIMEAVARPGTLQRLPGAAPPAPLSPAAGAVVLTLCDGDTPLHLAGPADCEAVRAWVAFHTGAPIAGPGACAFALGTWDALLPLSAFPVGAPDYPDRAATLIVEMAMLEAEGATLRGPGIRETAALSLPETEAFRANAARFPLGLDFLFTCGERLAALPRTTVVGAPADKPEMS